MNAVSTLMRAQSDGPLSTGVGKSVAKSLDMLNGAAAQCTASMRMDTSPEKFSLDTPLPFEDDRAVNSKCKPWDYGRFVQRASTFAISTWFGKPVAVGPLVCARFGWTNMASNRLQCISCNAQIIDKVSENVDFAGATRASMTLVDRLTTAHKDDCPWLNNPSPICFLSFQVKTKPEMVLQAKIRREKLQKLLRDGGGAPMLDLSEVKKAMKTTKVGTLDVEKDLALTMALFGWEGNDELAAVCRVCNRTCAIFKHSFNPLDDHRYFCPYRVSVDGKEPGWKIVLASYSSVGDPGTGSSLAAPSAAVAAVDPVDALKRVRAAFSSTVETPLKRHKAL
jgi:hypothetical protein